MENGTCLRIQDRTDPAWRYKWTGGNGEGKLVSNVTYSIQSPEWVLNVLGITSSLLIENTCTNVHMATGDECESMPALCEVQVKVPTLMSHACANLRDRIFFFPVCFVVNPGIAMLMYHVEITYSGQKVKHPNFRKHNLCFPFLYVSIMNQSLITWLWVIFSTGPLQKGPLGRPPLRLNTDLRRWLFAGPLLHFFQKPENA